MYGMSGYRGEWNNRGGWDRRGYRGRGPHGFFFFPILLLAGFAFFGLFKFLLPLIVIGMVVTFVSSKMRGGFGGHGRFHHHGGGGREFWNQRWNWENEWSEKRKHDWNGDEKPKRDDSDDSPRYARTANGDWVEIV